MYNEMGMENRDLDVVLPWINVLLFMIGSNLIFIHCMLFFIYIYIYIYAFGEFRSYGQFGKHFTTFLKASYSLLLQFLNT